jgi:CDP-glucose 4,6-dehydratase
LNLNVWQGRRVLVTGVTGFKGSWLTLLLARMGARVCGFSLPPPTQPSLFERAGVSADVDWTPGDVRCLEEVRAAVRLARAEVVFHLAAQPLVRLSYEQPVETLQTNVMGTVHLLEAVRSSPDVRVVIVVTSDKCYEDLGGATGYREGDRLGGHDPYASSKACAELVTAAYRRSYFAAGAVKVASVRAGNVIGGGDWARDRLVPDLVTALASGEPAILRNPAAVRPWQHVLDPLAGYVLLAERGLEGAAAVDEAWNFGPDGDSERTVSHLADDLCRLWGGGARWQRDGGAHPHETLTLRLDSSKAREQLGWRPRLPYARAIEWTATWYRDVLGGADARAKTLRQIDDYMEVPG